MEIRVIPERFTLAAVILLVLSYCSVVRPAAAEPCIRGRTSFNNGWRFHKGEADGAQSPAFDDSAWRCLQLPHDWAIEGPFDIRYNARCGGLPFHGVGWYRKSFQVSESDRGKQISVEFDGAMYNAEVWLNGNKVGNRPFGYIGFVCDLTPHLNYGDQANVLAVRLAPEDLSSRWYPGAGIYRNVWLDVKSPLHIAHWGTYVTTPKVTPNSATVQIETTIQNDGKTDAEAILETVICDAEGTEVARATRSVTVKAGDKQFGVDTIQVDNPRLWDTDDPHRYLATTRIVQEKQEVDRYVTPFGIRTIEFDAKTGCKLNGKPLRFQGVCMHHDLGPLGAAVNLRATMRQLEIMKSMGVNAIRTSHNPPSPEQLECCDRLGLVVMDESFDVWRIPKVENGYNKFFDQWAETDLRDMIRRDRNHPCVVMWSIGNEILEQGRKDGWQLARELTAICHDEDPTRPVAAGFNHYPGAEKNGLAAEVDIVGWNYKPRYYEEVVENHPDWIMCGSETSSCVSTRGEYHFPLEKYKTHESNQVTSYDFIGPVWAYPPDFEFYALEKSPQMIGEFVWTGFDYLGEPTPYGGRDNSTNGYWNGDWPVRSSFFGTVDLCGFPKDRFYLYQSQWTKEPMVHLLPHWTWPERVGQETPVVCYSNCDQIELIVNGKSQGRKARFSEPVELPMSPKVVPAEKFSSKYRLQWIVPYHPGSIKAVGYIDGRQVCTKEIKTAGPPAKIRLIPDRNKIDADGSDLSFITVRIEDAQGNLCPEAENQVQFKVTGPGAIAAVGNGNPATIESFQADHRKAFHGLCMLIVKSRADQTGTISVVAESEGLASAATELATVADSSELGALAPDFKFKFGKVERSSVLVSKTKSIWGGSLVKGDDGLYHMFYSRWPKELGWVWVSHSEIAHAVAKSPFGPFEFQDVALPPRGADHWDGLCTHNPTVHRFGDKYYLYYMGNTGDGRVVGVPGKSGLNWLHRNNQRIGVAVADDPGGPWQRFDRPVLDVSSDDSAPDCLMTSNPSVCQRPDGGYLMVYKAVGKQYDLPGGGPVVHCIATADSPTGPFTKYDKPIFTVEGERFPAEDPYIWYQDGKYRAIVKRIKHEGNQRLFSLVHYDSVDGFDWRPAKYYEVSDRTLTWADGQVQKFNHLERPQVYIENGEPVALLCAADTIDENNVRHSFNVQIPLKVAKIRPTCDPAPQSSSKPSE